MRYVSLAALVSVIMVSGTAHADDPYRVRAEVDLPLLAVGATFGAGWMLRHQLEPAWCAPSCNSEKLNALDRPVAGNWNPTWSRASDIGVAAIVVSGLVIPLVDSGMRDGMTDVVVIGESFVLANAVAVIAEVGVRRPRPFLYSEKAPVEERTDGNGSLSFFSGHSTISFATSVATFATLHRRHPKSPLPWVFLGASLATSVFVATGRMISGNHFPTDVIGGAVVGSSFGLLVPALHEVNVAVTPVVSADTRGLAIAARF